MSGIPPVRAAKLISKKIDEISGGVELNGDQFIIVEYDKETGEIEVREHELGGYGVMFGADYRTVSVEGEIEYDPKMSAKFSHFPSIALNAGVGEKLKAAYIEVAKWLFEWLLSFEIEELQRKIDTMAELRDQVNK